MQQNFTYEELLLIYDGLEKLPEKYKVLSGKCKNGMIYGSVDSDSVKNKVKQYGEAIEKEFEEINKIN